MAYIDEHGALILLGEKVLPGESATITAMQWNSASDVFAVALRIESTGDNDQKVK